MHAGPAGIGAEKQAASGAAPLQQLQPDPAASGNAAPEPPQLHRPSSAASAGGMPVSDPAAARPALGDGGEEQPQVGPVASAGKADASGAGPVAVTGAPSDETGPGAQTASGPAYTAPGSHPVVALSAAAASDEGLEIDPGATAYAGAATAGTAAAGAAVSNAGLALGGMGREGGREAGGVEKERCALSKSSNVPKNCDPSHRLPPPPLQAKASGPGTYHSLSAFAQLWVSFQT